MHTGQVHLRSKLQFGALEDHCKFLMSGQEIERNRKKKSKFHSPNFTDFFS